MNQSLFWNAIKGCHHTCLLKSVDERFDRDLLKRSFTEPDEWTKIKLHIGTTEYALCPLKN